MALITKIDKAKPTKKKKRVAAYCRVSTDQNDQLTSLEAQKAHYESWIKSHSKWKYVGLYYDEGISGTKMKNRPALLRLIEDCEHGLIDHVVTKSVSRLARNTTDLLSIVRRLLDLNVSIYFEKENIDTGVMENELMLSIMSSIAEGESVSISENNKWSMQKRFSNGTFKCSCTPYGYDWDKEKGNMVINEEQASVVRFIYERTLAGVGTEDVAKELTSKGIPTKRGGRWTGHTVNLIVRNEKYIGDCLLQKWYTDEFFVRRKNSGERAKYLITDHHEPIISKEVYEAANAVIDMRREEKGIETESEKYHRQYPFTGKVVCGECGGIFKRKTYPARIALACTNHLHNKNSCSMKYVVLEDVEIAFATMMNKLVFGKNRILKPFIKELQESDQSEATKKLNDLKDELERLSDKRQTITGLFSQGIIEPAVYTQSINDVKVRMSEISSEMKGTSYIASGEFTHIEEAKSLLAYAEKGILLEDFDGEIFEKYVERIVVNSRTEVEFHLKSGLRLTERIG